MRGEGGVTRHLFAGWTKEAPSLRLCHHWLKARESLVSLSPNRSGLSPLELGRGVEWHAGGF